MMRYTNEQSDIVNEQDQVVAQKLRSEVKGDFVNIFIRDSKGRFWIPDAKDDLKRWPSIVRLCYGTLNRVDRQLLAP